MSVELGKIAFTKVKGCRRHSVMVPWSVPHH